MSASILPRRLAAVTLAVAVAGSLAFLAAPAAHADTLPAPVPGISDTCSSLVVKPKGFVDKGEVRVVVDGEIQTDGSTQRDSSGDDWRVFKGSFPGVYDFDPTVAHRYSVDLNSFGADSAGRDFTPGSGSDATVSGMTTPCSPVSLRVATTNCTNPDRSAQQGLDLSVGSLRRSTTYLIEVLTGGEVVKHFQFRTQPEITKHFSGLLAGVDYVVRVTDQSDDGLSTVESVTLPGCAAPVSLQATVSQCTAVGGSRSITADIASLVTGRGYDVALTRSGSGSGQPIVSLVGDDLDHRVEFSGLAVGAYRVEVSDDAAPRTTRSAELQVASCADDPAQPGSPASPVTPGSPVSPGSPVTPGSPASSSPAPGASGTSGSAGSDGSSSSSGSSGTTSAAAQARQPGGTTSTGWANRASDSVRSHVAVSVDGTPVAIAAPGSSAAPAPGEPTAVLAVPSDSARSALLPIVAGVGGGLALLGVGVGAWLLWRRRSPGGVL